MDMKNIPNKHNLTMGNCESGKFNVADAIELSKTAQERKDRERIVLERKYIKDKKPVAKKIIRKAIMSASRNGKRNCFVPWTSLENWFPCMPVLGVIEPLVKEVLSDEEFKDVHVRWENCDGIGAHDRFHGFWLNW